MLRDWGAHHAIQAESVGRDDCSRSDAVAERRRGLQLPDSKRLRDSRRASASSQAEPASVSAVTLRTWQATSSCMQAAEV